MVRTRTHANAKVATMSDSARQLIGFSCAVLIALAAAAYDAAKNACIIQSPDFTGSVRAEFAPKGSPTPLEDE